MDYDLPNGAKLEFCVRGFEPRTLETSADRLTSRAMQGTSAIGECQPLSPGMTQLENGTRALPPTLFRVQRGHSNVCKRACMCVCVRNKSSSLATAAVSPSASGGPAERKGDGVCVGSGAHN